MPVRTVKSATAGEAGNAPPCTRCSRPVGGQLAQVAADGVLGELELGGELLGDHASLGAQGGRGSGPCAGQRARRHLTSARFFLSLHVSARYRTGMTSPLMILIAGPYRSGTDDDPARLAANLQALEEAAWPIFRAGHVPMIGEWVALPVMRGAGSTRRGRPGLRAGALPDRRAAAAALRRRPPLPGASTGADQDVRDRPRTRPAGLRAHRGRPGVRRLSRHA